MRTDFGLTLWFGAFLLLVVLSPGFEAIPCEIRSTILSLTENVPKDEIIYNFSPGDWKFVSSKPSDFIEIDKNGTNYYLKTIKEIDLEVMKETSIKVKLFCNGDKTMTFRIGSANEFKPKFTNPTFEVSIPENEMKGSHVFNAKQYSSDSDFDPTLTYSAIEYSSLQVPPDGISSKMFKVTSNGVVEVIGNLDYEKEKQYVVKIHVTDGTFDDTMVLTINVTDIDDIGPVFIVPSNSNPPVYSPLPAIYNSEININFTGELPISPVPIEAKDIETHNYKVKYSIQSAMPLNFISYFNIDNVSGKVNVHTKLPADVPSPGTLYIKAEDISAKQRSTIAVLIVFVTEKPVTTTQKTTTVTAGLNQTTETVVITTTLQSRPTSSSPSSLSVTPGQNQTTANSLNSRSQSPPLLSSSSSPLSVSVTPEQNQTTVDSLDNSSTSLPPSTSPSLLSVTPGLNDATTHLLNSSLASQPSGQGQTTGTTFSNSSASQPSGQGQTTGTTFSNSSTSLPPSASPSLLSVTPGQNAATTHLLNSSLTSLPPSTSPSLLSVTPGQNAATTHLLNSSLASQPSGQGQTTGTTFSDSSITTPPQTVNNPGKQSGTIAGDVFYGVLAALLVIILILVMILIFCCWRRKKKNDEEAKESKILNVPPFISSPEYDNVSKNSSKMMGIDNNAAYLTDILEDGQLPNDKGYEDAVNLNSAAPSDIIENTVNKEDLSINMEPEENINNSASESLQNTIDDSSSNTIPNYATHLPLAAIDDDTEDKINTSDDTESQLLSDAPVTMTFADLSKKNCVSFADDSKPLYDDNDYNDSHDNNDGLSYVDHIDDDNDNDDEHSNNGSSSSDVDSNFTEKSEVAHSHSDNNAEEMTWLVAESDGEQGQIEQDKEGHEHQEQPQAGGQQKLSYNNEIGYSPLLDDSQRDSQIGDDEHDNSIRL